MTNETKAMVLSLGQLKTIANKLLYDPQYFFKDKSISLKEKKAYNNGIMDLVDKLSHLIDK